MTVSFIAGAFLASGSGALAQAPAATSETAMQGNGATGRTAKATGKAASGGASGGHGKWTWMGGASVPGPKGIYGTLGKAAPGNVPGARGWAVSWTDGAGNFWLFGGEGFGDDAINAGYLNDLWKYSAGEWTWESGPNVSGRKGTYGTRGTAAAGNIPGARSDAVGWVDAAGNMWLFGGFVQNAAGVRQYLNDLWKYEP